MIEDNRLGVVVGHIRILERSYHLRDRSHSAIHVIVVITPDFLHGSITCIIRSYRRDPTSEYGVGVDPDILLDESGIYLEKIYGMIDLSSFGVVRARFPETRYDLRLIVVGLDITEYYPISLGWRICGRGRVYPFPRLRRFGPLEACRTSLYPSLSEGKGDSRS